MQQDEASGGDNKVYGDGVSAAFLNESAIRRLDRIEKRADEAHSKLDGHASLKSLFGAILTTALVVIPATWYFTSQNFQGELNTLKEQAKLADKRMDFQMDIAKQKLDGQIAMCNVLNQELKDGEAVISRLRGELTLAKKDRLDCLAKDKGSVKPTAVSGPAQDRNQS